MVVTRPISGDPIVVNPTGGTTGLITGGLTTGIVSEATMLPLQLLGFIPLVECDLNECRTYYGDCYWNKVFGSLNTPNSTYENDVNTFYISDPNFRKTFWWIQKLDVDAQEWVDVTRVGASTGLSGFPVDLTYGTYYNYGYFTAFPYYQGYQVNWGHVLTNSGTGRYRIRVETPPTVDAQPQPFPYCMVSEPFELMAWDCKRAHGTVKFEAFQSGRIGSITTDGLVFNLCNIKLYDSVRIRGFFGREKTTYDEIMQEFQTGKMDRVRDEAIQKFEYSTHPLPKYLHDRFKTYGLMADALYVSDYNLNNSDYDIKRKSVIKAAAYEPEYVLYSRLATVETEFKEGVQGVIKSTSCQPTR